MKAVVLFSGGIDSATCIKMLLGSPQTEAIYPLYVNYGQKQHYQELKAMEKIMASECQEDRLKSIKFIDIQNIKFRSSLTDPDLQIPMYNDKGDDTTNVPLRGVLLVSIAVAYADRIGADSIYMMNHATQPDLEATHYDANNDALDLLEKLVSLGTNHKIKLVNPFKFMLKKQIFEMARSYKINFDDCWSCYTGNDVPCGTCRACYERSNGLKEIGVLK